MTAAETTRLRRIYADICRGYSETVWQNQTVYVKHLNVFDQTEIDAFYENAFEKNIKRGLYTEKTRLDYLMLHGIWTKKNELELKQQESFLDNLHKTRSKVALKLQADQLEKQIKEESEKLSKMRNKRVHFLGLTAEKVTDEQTQYRYIKTAFYKDRSLKQPMFSEDEMKALSEEESFALLGLYINIIQNFSEKNIRIISIQPFFVNTFYLCKENIHVFFNKPMVELSIYQVNLLSYGQYFRSILTSHDVPSDMLQDPDKLEEFVNRSKNMKKIVEKASVSQGGRVGIVGAAPEDFAAIGVKDSTEDMRKVAEKQYKTGKEGAENLGFTYTN